MGTNEKSPVPAASPPGKGASNPSSPGKGASNPSSPRKGVSSPSSPPAQGASSPSSQGGQADPITGILPPEHWATIAEEQGEGDETESERASTTASITSSILRYRTIHGRRFHSEIGNAEYWATNDEPQNESMSLNHHAMTLMMGNKLFKAPLDMDKVQKVLDVGTGNGIWAIDFADEHQDVEVIGTDISPTQPTWVPPNLKFEIEDCTGEWTFDESFDYVHARWLIGSIPDWTAMFKQAYKVLKPGGWIETHEPASHIISQDGTVTPESALGQWGKIFDEGGKKLGQTFNVVDLQLQRKGLEEAGFVDIQEVDMVSPIGSWPKDPALKEQGTIQQMAFLADIEGYVLFVSAALGWSRPEIHVLVAQLRREMRSGEYHPFYKQKAVWGRKPG